jgi:hypothetical protein
MSELSQGPDWWKAADGKWYSPLQGQPSDTQHGPGWWRATDGKWYPPTTDERFYNRPQASDPSAPSRQGAAVQQTGNGLAVAALALGLLAVVFVLVLFLLVALLCAVSALILGIAGRRKAGQIEGAPRKGMATAGIVLGALSVVFSLLLAWPS